MLKKYKLSKYLVSSIIFYAVISVLSLISPYIMGLIVDNYLPTRNINGLILGIVLFVTIPFIVVGLQLTYNYVMIKIVRNKGNELSIDIMSNLIYQEYVYFDKENSLELLSYVSKETVGYLNFYIIDMPKYYVDIIITVVVFVLLMFINPILGIIQLLYIPLVLLPTKKIMASTEKEIEIVVENNAKINQIKGDIFKGIEFVKTNRIEEIKLEEVKKANSKITKVWGKVAALDTLTGIWSNGFMTLLFTGLTFGLGAIFIYNNILDFTIGLLISLISYVAIYYNKVNGILNTKVSKKKEDANFKQVLSYLNLKDELADNLKLDNFEFNKEIKLVDLNFSYNEDKVVLKDINLTIPYNKWTTIIGESGSGKSTIADLLIKLYKVSVNQIFIDGKDINKINAFNIRDNVSKVSQDIYLFPGSIKENLILANSKASDKDIMDALKFVKLDEFINKLPNGINTEIGEAGKLMSGGEKQRLSIAYCLLRGNKTLILDEVSSNLDIETTKFIADNFKKLLDKGYTIVSISHDSNFNDYSDIIYEIKDGIAIINK